MSGKRRIKHLPSIQKPQLDYSKLDINQIDSVIKGLEVQKNIVLEKSLNGGDLEQIMKAQSYLSKNEKTKPQIKSHIFVPEDYQYTGRGYKDSYSGVPFEVLQRMSNIPIVRTIIGTRIDQIKNFLKYSNDDQVAGYKVKRKTGLFTEDNKKELSAEDKRKIEFIVNCLEYGGKGGKWDDGDDLHDFVTKIMSDSLSIDQATAEIIRDRKGDYYKHAAVDGSLIRLLDSTDVRYQKQFEDMQVNGYLPKYGQVWNGQIVNNPVTGEPVIYYPWQLMYGVRNKTTDVRANGYGKSELEVGLELITYIVWGIQYNGNFFKQGSNPKGFVNIKNGNLNNSVLNEFRQAWTQLVVGVNNSHRLPIFEGIDLEWIDLQSSNKDMEFQQWNEFLIVLLCALYKIDPSELGFHFKNQADMFGQQGQKERIDHSRKKGLEPLLVFLQKLITKYIVSEIDENYEFVFTGLSIEDESAQVELDTKKLTGGMVSFESMFEKYMGRKYDEKKDTILNAQFLQAKQMSQYGGQEMNDMVDEQTGEPEAGIKNPFDEFEKSKSSDPIVAAALRYMDENLIK